MLAIFLFFFPLCEVQKVQSASLHVVLAPWRSRLLGMFYNPLELSSSSSATVLFLRKECSLIRRERDPSTSNPCTTAPSTQHSRDSASTVAYAESSPASPPWPAHPGREAYPDQNNQAIHRHVRPGVGLLLKHVCTELAIARQKDLCKLDGPHPRRGRCSLSLAGRICVG